MANYSSSYTGEQIDDAVGEIVANDATSGQVLTANGSGGAEWNDIPTNVSSLGGATGAITLGTGLSMSGNQLSAANNATFSLSGTELTITNT